MKKIYLLLGALMITCTSFAQTISNAGFENWRASTVGGVDTMPTVNIHAPFDWYGFDSLIIDGEENNIPGFLGYGPTDLHAQVFQETTLFHGGAASAKLVSLKQDTLGALIMGTGFIAGAMSNAQPSLNTTALALGDLAHAITYTTSGTPTTLRITSASAWIAYFPGKDPGTGLFGGVDSGTFVVQAISSISGIDSVVGSGTLNIGSTPTFTQYTVNLAYTDTQNHVMSVRINFASSQLFASLDSSIMYVDDVSMVGIPQAVNNVTLKNDLVKVYPNPATGIIHLDGPQNTELTCELISVSGQVVRSMKLKGSGGLDVSSLPNGLYMYTISDASGNKVQRGKVTVNN